MKKALLCLPILALFVVLSSGLAGAEEKPMIIKLASLGKADPCEEAGHAGYLNFKYIVEKGSGGRFQVDIYPAGTLGKETDLIPATKNDVVQVYSASLVGLHRIFKPAMVAQAPYIFRNEQVAWEVIDGPFGQKLLEAFTEKTGIKGLSIMHLGFSCISNNIRPLTKPADFKGIKFRGMGPLQVNMFESLGGSAVPIAWPEVYTSLQTGVVDGQTNPPHIINSFKIYEVQKYLTLSNSSYPYQFWIASKRWFDGLSYEDKKLILRASKVGAATARMMSMVGDQQAIKAMQEKGMKVNALSPVQMEEFIKLARPGGLKWLKTQMAPKWVDDLMAAVDAAEKKLGYK